MSTRHSERSETRTKSPITPYRLSSGRPCLPNELVRETSNVPTTVSTILNTKSGEHILRDWKTYRSSPSTISYTRNVEMPGIYLQRFLTNLHTGLDVEFQTMASVVWRMVGWHRRHQQNVIRLARLAPDMSDASRLPQIVWQHNHLHSAIIYFSCQNIFRGHKLVLVGSGPSHCQKAHLFQLARSR
jgi:hypothetical protein